MVFDLAAERMHNSFLNLSIRAGESCFYIVGDEQDLCEGSPEFTNICTWICTRGACGSAIQNYI